MITGSVNPDGLPAGYAFELGVYNGAQTQYTIVQSGAAGSGSEPVSEAFGLSGLQPGTTYEYRIAVTSGYILNGSNTLQGVPITFTTAGTANVLVSPPASALLATPSVLPEPKTPVPKKCKRGYKRDKRNVCVKQKPKKKARKARKSSPRGARKTK